MGGDRAEIEPRSWLTAVGLLKNWKSSPKRRGRPARRSLSLADPTRPQDPVRLVRGRGRGRVSVRDRTRVRVRVRVRLGSGSGLTLTVS